MHLLQQPLPDQSKNNSTATYSTCWIRRIIIPLFSAFIVWHSSGHADEEIRYGADVTRLPVSADIAAMGDAGVVLPRRAAALVWNPASPAYLDRYEFSAEGADLYQHLSQHGCFAGNIPLRHNSAVAISYLPFYSGIIPRYDTIAAAPEYYTLKEYKPKGYFKNYHHALHLALARRFSLRLPRLSQTELPLPFDISVGANCKAYVQTMNPDGTYHMGLGYNADIGVLFRIGMDYDLATRQICRELYFGATVRDILPSEIIWIYSKEDTWRYAPEDYREPFNYAHYYGIAYVDKSGDLPIDWTVALSLHKEYEVTYHCGIEVEFLKMIVFRTGLSDRTPAIGAGFHHRNFFIDYAFRFDPVAISYARLTAGFFFPGRDQGTKGEK